MTDDKSSLPKNSSEEGGEASGHNANEGKSYDARPVNENTKNEGGRLSVHLHSGPLPPPEVFNAYPKEAQKVILDEWKKETESRRSITHKQFNGSIAILVLLVLGSIWSENEKGLWIVGGLFFMQVFPLFIAAIKKIFSGSHKNGNGGDATD